MVALTDDFDAKKILERAKSLLKVDSDRDFAAATGIPYQTLISWKKRNSIPLSSVIEMAETAGCLLDYLVFGERFIDPIRNPPKIDASIMNEVIRMVCRAAELDDKTASKISYEANLYYTISANMMDVMLNAGVTREDASATIKSHLHDVTTIVASSLRE